MTKYSQITDVELLSIFKKKEKEVEETNFMILKKLAEFEKLCLEASDIQIELKNRGINA
jgi:hypothetical protein